jgi:hypothetical protein
VALELGDYIKILPEVVYDFWNNTQFTPEEYKGLPIFKVRQISFNYTTQVYKLALENIDFPGFIDYRTVPAEKIQIVPQTKDGKVQS